MAKNLFAWASIDEHGKTSGGTAGNQTGRELKVGELYDFGQTHVLRINDAGARTKAAKYALILAENVHIGYDQKNRTSLYNLAKSVGWDLDSLLKKLASKDVECDCSSFAATIINMGFGSTVVPCFTTATIAESVSKNSEFTVLAYDKAKKAFKKGDCVYKAGKHVIINV